MQVVNGDGKSIFEEQTFPNCTVIQYKNLLTGDTQICWWDNTNPMNTYVQDVEDE